MVNVRSVSNRAMGGGCGGRAEGTVNAFSTQKRRCSYIRGPYLNVGRQKQKREKNGGSMLRRQDNRSSMSYAYNLPTLNLRLKTNYGRRKIEEKFILVCQKRINGKQRHRSVKAKDITSGKYESFLAASLTTKSRKKRG